MINFYKNFKKSISTYFYFSFIPFTIFFFLILGFFVTGIIPLKYLWFTFLGWILISGLGIETGYHRIFSHKTHPDLPTWKENIILFFGALGGMGSSITYAAIHRGYHHRYTDTEKDLHSPVHGFWNSFVGWTLPITENNPIIKLNAAVDLLRKPNHVWFHNNQLKIQWLVPLFIAVFDWKLSIALLIFPTSIHILQINLINYIAHQKLIIGYRYADSNDHAYNNILVALIFNWGQGWHHGHHSKPNSFNPGSSVSGNWWEIDTCSIFLPFIGKPRPEAR